MESEEDPTPQQQPKGKGRAPVTPSDVSNFWKTRVVAKGVDINDLDAIKAAFLEWKRENGIKSFSFSDLKLKLRHLHLLEVPPKSKPASYAAAVAPHLYQAAAGGPANVCFFNVCLSLLSYPSFKKGLP